MVEKQSVYPSDFEFESMVDKIEEFAKNFEPSKGKYYIVLDDFQTTVGGVEMPEKHSEQTRIATVHGVGDPADEYSKPRYRVGDRVLIEFHSGTKLHILSYYVMDEKFRVVFEEEILGKIRG